MNKILSIVIPVYNTEKYLPKCLDSLLIKENVDLLEVLIIVDGSPDNSFQIATEYSLKYPELFKVINKENGGHGSCCNVGIQKANGKYIKFLDSDDWFDTESLVFLVSRLKDCDADVFFTHSIKEIVYENRTENYGYKFDYVNEEVDIKNLKITINPKQPVFFTLADCGFSAELLRKIDMKFTERVSFDDNILYLLPFVGVKRILFLDITLYHYFIGRPEQSMVTFTPVKYAQATAEYLKSLKVCKQLEVVSFNENVEQYIRIFTSKLIDAAYCFLFNSNPQQQHDYYIQLKSIIGSTSFLKDNTSKYHKIFKHLPFNLAKILFSCRKNLN